MIQLQEIRIGNLVFDKKRNRIVTVWGIESNHDKIVVNFANGSGVYSIDLKHIEPIPITEEILLKFGFYFEDGFYCLRINNTAFITIILLGSYVNYELSNFRQKIVFSRGEFSGVHQLQNLYFDLKGEHLMFKNK